MSKLIYNKIEPFNVINSIMTLYEQGKFHSILKRANQLIDAYPNTSELYQILGNTSLKTGNTRVAIKYFRKVIKLCPSIPYAYTNLGVALLDFEAYEELKTAFEKAIELNPTYFEPYNSISFILRTKGDFKGAIKILIKATKKDPKNYVAYNDIAILQKRLGDLKGSIENYKKAININPKYFNANQNLGNLYRDLGDYDNAISSYQRALRIKPNDPQVTHMLNAVCGDSTSRPPSNYVEDLFDEYASFFEDSLTQKLDYKIPSLISSYLKKNNHKTNKKIIDLGCGTGLLGLELNKYFDYIEGIDLSSSMIQEAKKKNVYNKLSKIDIFEYLSTEILDFDFFISLDVFIYIGEISDIFKLIKSRNKRKGKFIFSTEHNSKKEFFLEKNGRFSHSKKYIDNLCKKFDYQISSFKKTKLRNQFNHYLIGGIYILDF